MNFSIMAIVKVYGLAMSTCTRRVLAVLEEKNVPYELVVVDLMKGEHKQPDFIAKQPFGQIPVLEDGDVRIFESRAIARYIVNKWGSQGTDLVGKDDKAKAATDAWVEVESNHFHGPASTIVFEKMFKGAFGAGPADEALVAAEVEKLNKVLDVYESILSKQPYLAGQEFSLADLSHLPYSEYLHKVGITEPFEKRPAVQAWWQRISARPSWKKLTA